MLDQMTKDSVNCVSRTCSAAGVDGIICRMFVCSRCLCQVLVCPQCDRGQIYCMRTCAREARRDRQREARRRYQATPRGRAMHAARNRHYRARAVRVTDHGPAKQPETALSRGLAIAGASRKPLTSSTPPGHHLCHRCGRSVSPFVRLTGLRPQRRPSRITRIDQNDTGARRPP